MNPSALFIRRPVATVLLTIGIALTGIAAYFALPVASLPAVDFPVISVQAQLPGASPRVMASSVATPLERHLGQIANVNELTSSSSLGRTNIVIQFGLNRNIDGAARDVQAAINAARADLPTTLRSNPGYNKQNPANAPIMILNLTSATLSRAQMYDAASLVLSQKLSQIEGVGEASIQGGSAPAVRVEINPRALNKYGIGLEDVRAAIAGANANQPKGLYSESGRRHQIYANDQAFKASDYRDLIIATRSGSPVRLSDVAEVRDGAESTKNLGLYNGKDAITVRIQAAPGANIVATVDRIKAVLPSLREALPKTIDLDVSLDRTTDIRGSLRDVERTLLMSIVLVVIVVLLFLRNGRATLIPAVAVVTSLLGTLGIMYLGHFSLDNLSLMALTVATGFVVDDAIVVLENITRHVEEGMPRFEAALRGAGEVGFTVISMSISLIAVFLPILLMGGVVGRLFREFAVTLSAAIFISLIVSLTTTPMMAARLVDERPTPEEEARRANQRGIKGLLGRIGRGMERGFAWTVETYDGSLTWALDHGRIVLVVLLATVLFNFYLYGAVAKGFMPSQDTGVMQGGIQVDQASSFAATSEKFKKLVAIVHKDPAVDKVTAFAGGSFGFMFVSLKPKAERGGLSTDQVIARIRPKTFGVAGAQLFLNGAQDFRAGGRQSQAQYQYTLQSDDIDGLKTWSTKLTEALKRRPELTDVNSDLQERGLETFITIDRDAAARLGLNTSQVINTLRDAYSQFYASTIFNELNQYRVVMEVSPEWAQNPAALQELYVTPGAVASYSAASPAVGTLADADRTSTAALTATRATAAGATRPAGLVAVAGGAQANARLATVAGPAGPRAPGGSSLTAGAGSGVTTQLAGAGAIRSTTGGSIAAQTGNAVSTTAGRAIPLSAFASSALGATATSVNHQGQAVSATISFNLPDGKSLSEAKTAIEEAQREIAMPPSVVGAFAGTAQQFNDTTRTMPLLILAALGAVYIVLGMLYESYIHPITVLSTLPSAGVGALLALMAFHVELDLIALIGIILLIGIVKKNAILIIDFALVAERDQGLTPREAIHQASLLRFRPILMTTMAAILGALPLAFGLGEGGELRRPLGIAIIGGLIASQVLTLITTPVVYLYMDKLRRRSPKRRGPERWAPSPEDPGMSPDPALVPRGTGLPAPQAT